MTDWVCSICLCKNKDNTVTLDGCNHTFHSQCIVTHLRINGPKCPNCRGLDERCNYSIPINEYEMEDSEDEEPFISNSFEEGDIYRPIGLDDDLEYSEFDIEIQNMLFDLSKLPENDKKSDGKEESNIIIEEEIDLYDSTIIESN